MSKKAIIAIAIVVVVIAGTLLMGVFGGGGGQKRAMGAVQVKAMNVLVQDTPLTLEYAGSVKGKDEVKVQARVSGNVTD
ncbi:MAG: efflux transporter periplasmic adaptor subunit, partial [Anaerovibrio sp.]|nr:efflux transporter periplasmic adaptor subunit [Anaerovibrio sp.]MDY2602940.1 efflux transporter periplasmic adaptor subunit [Anaerovibrio sp.]